MHFNNKSKDENLENSNQSVENLDDQKQIEVKKSFNFFQFLAAIFILILVVITSILVFILVLPENPISKTIVTKTFLNNFIDLPTSQSDDNSSQTNSSTKIFNSIITSDENQYKDLQFSPEINSIPLTEAVEKVLPSVLSISVREKDKNLDSFSESQTAGTGFIVNKEGLVLTNKHVISTACTVGSDNIQITALNHEQKALKLKLLSIDPVEDIAILKIEDSGNYQAVDIQNSEDLKLGQEVMAIGNVLGELQNTVTSGIVSGLNRDFKTNIVDKCTAQEFQANNLIQIDAAINRGNSGGPLFNSSGQLIGMNTLGTTDAENIGLAIPSVNLKKSIETFNKNKTITRARIQVKTVPINAILQTRNTWLPVDYGEIIYNQKEPAVPANSPEAKVNLQEGDIILEVDGQKLITGVVNQSPLQREILKKDPNQTIKLKVLKVASSTKEGFSYQKDSVEVEIKLGSIKYNLETNKLDISS
jgi:S1-C subfamily serine protease